MPQGPTMCGGNLGQGCCAVAGVCCLSMATVVPNSSVNQAVCCNSGCGGAAGLSAALNNIGKWGTVLLATAQGKAVKTGTTQVGAKGSTSVAGGLSANSLILILLVVGVLIFVATRK